MLAALLFKVVILQACLYITGEFVTWTSTSLVAALVNKRHSLVGAAMRLSKSSSELEANLDCHVVKVALSLTMLTCMHLGESSRMIVTEQE